MTRPGLSTKVVDEYGCGGAGDVGGVSDVCCVGGVGDVCGVGGVGGEVDVG